MKRRTSNRAIALKWPYCIHSGEKLLKLYIERWPFRTCPFWCSAFWPASSPWLASWLQQPFKSDTELLNRPEKIKSKPTEAQSFMGLSFRGKRFEAGFFTSDSQNVPLQWNKLKFGMPVQTQVRVGPPEVHNQYHCLTSLSHDCYQSLGLMNLIRNRALTAQW